MKRTLLSIVFTVILTTVNVPGQATQSYETTPVSPNSCCKISQNMKTLEASLYPVRDHHFHHYPWIGPWGWGPVEIDPRCTEICTAWGCHWECNEP